jgi:hypothetical protein
MKCLTPLVQQLPVDGNCNAQLPLPLLLLLLLLLLLRLQRVTLVLAQPWVQAASARSTAAP